jgi:signal transduction histidine kinase
MLDHTSANDPFDALLASNAPDADAHVPSPSQRFDATDMNDAPDPLAEAQAEIARLRAEIAHLRLEVAEQSHARDAFISLAAHELRSPLTTVKGYAQLLLRQARKIALPPAMERSVAAIDEQTARMSDMVGAFYDALRIRRGDFELTRTRADLVALTTAEVERRRPLAPEHTVLLLAEEPSLVGQWDATRVSQIIHALLDNALRYSPAGGGVALRLAQEDGMATLSVRDQGIGVAPADREHIFEYLYRAPDAERRNLNGVGLGLYISRAIAERLGGRLWLAASDTSGGGSEFRLALPPGV